ncbi:MAG: peptide chain release factor N(5)-glutamine methyltransferase [Flavobacteriales bacterium AspAUS03]
MKLHELYSIFHEVLQEIYPLKEERESLFFLLITNILECDKATVRLRLINQEILDEITYEKLMSGLADLQNNKPIQYVLGQAHFFGLDWVVDERVLIPRPETEELISWVISDQASKGPLRLLDVGTGSGCIAISLKHRLPEVEIHALDILDQALEIARQNAVQHNVEVFFHQLDILQDLPEFWPSFDVIVSNPPYIKESEKVLMHPNIYQYEPAKALFVPDEAPLIFYRKIVSWAKQKLSAQGVIYFEINQFLATETALLIEELGCIEVEIRKDIQGHPRMLKALIGC